MACRMGGRGNLVYPRSKVYPDGSCRKITRHPPADFRERYLEDGWDAHMDMGCGWKTFCRWIDQCGGDELRAARAAVVKARGPRLRSCVGTGRTNDSAWYVKRRGP